jgi:predicted HTH domain antitoxin
LPHDDGERIKVPLAIGLYAERAVSLAKAARLAGMTRYEFALLLKKRDLPAYEYTQQDYQEDLRFAASYTFQVPSMKKLSSKGLDSQVPMRPSLR